MQTHRGFAVPRKCPAPTQTDRGVISHMPSKLATHLANGGSEIAWGKGESPRWRLRCMIFGENVETTTRSKKPQGKQRARPARSRKLPWRKRP